jgi:hypothetical protein
MYAEKFNTGLSQRELVNVDSHNALVYRRDWEIHFE